MGRDGGKGDLGLGGLGPSLFCAKVETIATLDIQDALQRGRWWSTTPPLQHPPLSELIFKLLQVWDMAGDGGFLPRFLGKGEGLWAGSSRSVRSCATRYEST